MCGIIDVANYLYFVSGYLLIVAIYHRVLIAEQGRVDSISMIHSTIGNSFQPCLMVVGDWFGIEEDYIFWNFIASQNDYGGSGRDSEDGS